MPRFLLSFFCQSKVFLPLCFEFSWKWGMCLKRRITTARSFQHANVDGLELFVMRNMIRRLFYRRYTEAPILACTAILKSLYLKMELSLFILQ